MTVNFSELLPWAAPALESLAHIPVIKYVNETVWIFALVETGHLLFLAVLGGAVFALNLRVLGLVLPAVSLQDVERAVRPWYNAGVAGALVTGLAMAITTARTLLPSGAFTADSYWFREIDFVSYMFSSTAFRRASAPAGFRYGEWRDGFCGRPA